MVRIRIAVSLIALLISFLANAGDIDQNLIDAAKNGDTAAVKVLLANCADPNTKAGRVGWTVLMFAAMKGHTAAVQTLPTTPAATSYDSPKYLRALTISSKERCEPCGRLILPTAEGVRPNSTQNFTTSAHD